MTAKPQNGLEVIYFEQHIWTHRESVFWELATRAVPQKEYHRKPKQTTA